MSAARDVEIRDERPSEVAVIQLLASRIGVSRVAPTLVCACIALASVVTFAQRTPASVVDLLVWGGDRSVASARGPGLASAVRVYRQRWDSYTPVGPKPRNGEEEMVFYARQAYERRLFAIARGDDAAALARAYVADLNPCYEWEGGAECPEREAVFADDYQAGHPRGPFAQFLPLLSAHRWLCAAEAYERDYGPETARASRSASDRALGEARRSTDPLVRFAAQELTAHRSCFAQEPH